MLRFGFLQLPAPGSANGIVVLGVRPEDLTAADGGLGFCIRVVEPLGPHLLLTGEAEGRPLRVVVTPDTVVRADETITLRPDIGHLAWLHPETGRRLDAR